MCFSTSIQLRRLRQKASNMFASRTLASRVGCLILILRTSSTPWSALTNRFGSSKTICFLSSCLRSEQCDVFCCCSTKTGLVFGRMNWIPSIQERFDHQRFPFDRQIIDIQMMMNNCQLKKWELDSINEYPPELSMDEPDIVAITELNAAADAWDLKTMLAHTVNDPTNKSSIVHFQVFLERASTFYFWNIVMVYFIIISLQVVLIAFPYNETRFEFSLTLALTTVAFMFVTTAMVPKTTYLTFMDKYMLSGLLVLFLRFGVDLAIQLVMEEELPFNDISGRASCTEENANSFGLTPCFVDAVATAVLTGFWLIYSVFIALCTFVFPGLIRMKWEKINKKVNNVSRQNKERAVVKKFITENRVIRSGDISDAVNYTASNEQMKSSI